MNDIRPLKSEADYDAALKETDALFNVQPNTPEGDRLEVLLTLIEAYENKHWPIDPPDAIEAIRFHMEQAGYRQADLARLLGSRSRASEIMNRKRHLTLENIWRLNREWNIPAESLIKPYDLVSSH
jgi:HTH-type transcriptional regulator/antitoxin HigA